MKFLRFHIKKVGHNWQIIDSNNHNLAVQFFSGPEAEELAEETCADLNERHEIKMEINELEEELARN